MISEMSSPFFCKQPIQSLTQAWLNTKSISNFTGVLSMEVQRYIFLKSHDDLNIFLFSEVPLCCQLPKGCDIILLVRIVSTHSCHCKCGSRWGLFLWLSSQILYIHIWVMLRWQSLCQRFLWRERAEQRGGKGHKAPMRLALDQTPQPEHNAPIEVTSLDQCKHFSDLQV